ncbi:MAG: glycosyltransferase family 39 protein [Chloroflexi bacterium]|nr:glycosyltransferase family 39 protein [Chloroflexota bacterium]
MPVDGFQAQVGQLLPGRQGGFYTQEFFRNIGERLRLSGLVLLLAAAVVQVMARSFQDFLEEAVVSAPALVGAIRGGLRTMFLPQYRLCLVGAILIVLIGTVARVSFLSQPARYDEAHTFNEFASRPLYYALSFYPEPNNQLFHTLLVHISSMLLGNQLWAIRLPALVAGILLVPTTYVLGHLLYGRSAGLLAAAAVAGSSFLVEYSTNARGYTLLTLLFLATLSLVAYARQTGNRAALLVSAILAALGFYTIPTMLYAFAPILAWAVVSILTAPTREIGRRGQELGLFVVPLAITGILVFLLYLPVILVSGPENLLSNRFVTPLGWDQVLASLPGSLASTWSFWNRDVPGVISVAFAAGVVVATVFVQDTGRGRVPLPLLAVGCCVSLVLAQRVVPFERVWIFLLPLYFLVACSGIVCVAKVVGARLEQRGKAIQAAAVASVALAVLMSAHVLVNRSVLYSSETGNFQDAEAITVTVRDIVQAGDRVQTIVPASLPQIQYYFKRHGLDPSLLVRDAEPGGRLFVIAPQPPPASLSTELQAVGITLENWVASKPVRQYETAVLYELTQQQ